MLTYEEFKGVLKEKLLDYMPEEFSEHKIVFRENFKINLKTEGLELVPHMDRSDTSAPLVDVKDMYSYYLDNKNLEKTLQYMAIQIFRAYQEVDRQELSKISSMDREEFLQNVIMVLINTEQNRELLKRTPHREFLDLSVVYQVPVKADSEHYGMARVTNEWASKLQVTENELYKMAMINTKMMYPPMVNSMKSMIKELCNDLDISPLNMDHKLEDHAMYVITNEENIFGANGMLYEDVLYGMAGIINSNLYILPSSLHELIVVKADSLDLKHLQETVRTINEYELSPKDKLSDNVYHYDKTLRKVTIAAEVPVKEKGIIEENRSRMEGEAKPWQRTRRL